MDFGGQKREVEWRSRLGEFRREDVGSALDDSEWNKDGMGVAHGGVDCAK